MDAELEDIYSKLPYRLKSANSPGTVFANGNAKIEVLESGSNDPSGQWQMFLDMNSYDQLDLSTLPGSGFMEGGKFVCVFGPEKSSHEAIEARLKEARQQAPSATSVFIVVLGTHNLVGRMEDHRMSLHRLLQPEKFTKISGVLLVNLYFEKHPMLLVSNPYATAPIHQNIRSLLELTLEINGDFSQT